MNKVKWWLGGVAAVVILSWAQGQSDLSAQSYTAEPVAEPRPVFDLPLVAPEAAPETGTFWLYSKSAGEAGWPPLPFDPYAGVLPIYILPGGQYLVADTPTDFAELQALQFQMAQLESGATLTTMDSSSELPPFPDNGDTNSGGGTLDGPLYTSPSYPSNALWLEITGVSNDAALVNLHGTVSGTLYELLSKEQLTNADWQSEAPLWLGAENQDWTPAQVPVGMRTNQLLLWARSWADADGNGIPDWWEQQYLGAVGVDPYADPDGDGWANLQEYQNGTDPNNFNTPPAPQGLTVTLGTNGTTASISWQPAGGTVTGYSIERSFDASTIEVTAPATSTTDNSELIPSGLYWSSDIPAYRITAHYTHGDSVASEWSADPRSQAPDAATVAGSAGQEVTIVGAVPPTAAALQVGYWFEDATHPLASVAAWDIPVGNLTNNQVAWNSAMVPPSGTAWGSQYARWVSTNGVLSAAMSQSTMQPSIFWDGREALAENLRFILRAANAQEAFNFLSRDPDTANSPSDNFADYAYAGLHAFDSFDPGLQSVELDEFLPFRRNYAYRNFVFSSSDLNANGTLNTGVHGWTGDDTLILDYPFAYRFTPPSSLASIPTLLATNDTRWTYFNPQFAGPDMGLIGISQSGTNLIMSANARNLFGLRYLSAHLTGSGYISGELSAGGSIPDIYSVIYPETEQPVFAHASYLFCHVYTDVLPGYVDFSPTNETPPIITGMADPWFQIAGYAKYTVANGYTNKPAFLGQYFDKAYKANPDGTRSTNETGILSPYGGFFATEPGKTFLTTKPDGVSTNVGECVVNVIKLQLDVNHDGTMETAWNSPDNTTQNNPFMFWVNNDFDRWHVFKDLNWNLVDEEYDDLSDSDPATACPANPGHPTPDCDYQELQGLYAIPSERDLEDYARLWIPGIAELYETHSNLLFQLSIANNDSFDGPAFNLTQAVETNGGTLYLTDTNIAAQQKYLSGSFVGRLQPNSPVLLNNLFLLSGHASDYLIFCGARRGKGEIVLTIKDGDNVLATTSTWVQLKDIKEMYERWSVCGIGTNAPTSTAYREVEGLPPGIPPFKYAQPNDPNTPYILHVHGWNMNPWEKNRFAETAFKRLYWQGYQGRFGSFDWPTYTGMLSFDRSENMAWQSAAPLRNLLVNLNSLYPNEVRLTAHSMGNVVAGEALRTNATLVHTYVAMQAAIPSHTYDPTTTNRSLGLLDSGTPNRYAEYWTNGASCYFYGTTGAARYINFFNKEDWALGLWETDQDSKPDGGTGYYFGNNTFYHETNVIQFPQNTFELFSFCVEARCYALGAQADVNNILLSDQQVDLGVGPYSFGNTHVGHSAQFRSTNMRRADFWDTLLRRIQLKN